MTSLVGALILTAMQLPLQPSPHLAWWQEARFGMFIHWGPVSLAGTEIGWSRAGERRGFSFGPGSEVPVETYDNLYRRFNPTKFDAEAWVRLAKSAGMRYLVFTSRHHDGFSMFDTKQSDYKITSPDSPFRRDVVRELADACHRAGLKFGLYYSQPDWRHPDAFTANHSRYQDYLKAQLTEILTNYGKVDLLWFDGLDRSDADYDGTGLLALARRLQPGIVINDRSGAGGDYATPEQTIGSYNTQRPWETCMTIGDQWSWKPYDRVKTLEQCLHSLIRCAGGDGNLLFNVGPMPGGEIEPEQQERLREMGTWLRRYGHTIYGTRGGPIKPSRRVVSTRKGKRVYIHILRWDRENLTLPWLGTKVLRASLLTGGQVDFEENIHETYQVRVAPKDRHPIDTIVQLDLEKEADEILDVAVGTGLASIAKGKPASASNTYRNDPSYGPDKAFDDDPETRWATDEGTQAAWLEVDLGRIADLDAIYIDEAYSYRIRSFEIQVRTDGDWKTILKDSTIGEERLFRIPNARARYVRLSILKAVEGPTIREFHISAK